MVVAIALDDDLVSAAPHDRAPAPAVALIDLIAQAGGQLAYINVPLEGLELPIRIHRTPHFSFPIARSFSSASHRVEPSGRQHLGASGDSVLQACKSSLLATIMRRAASVSL